MAATIEGVRIKIRDTVEPFTYTNDEVTAALDEAADWLDIQKVRDACPKYDMLHKLVAARLLLSAAGAASPSAPSHITAMTEGNKSLSFETVADSAQSMLSQLSEEIEQYLAYCKKGTAAYKPGGIGALYGNY